MWTQARFAAYITSAIVGLAAVLSALGVAEYDSATGMIDLHPFSVYSVAGIVAAPLASGMAAVMVWVQGRGK